MPAPKPTHVQFFPSATAFRTWLKKNGRTARELWVGFYQKSSGKPSITYPEALDEALCCGWIDGIRHKVAADAYTSRFTPRRPKSQWSAVNLKRVQELAKAGRMLPEGTAALAAAKTQDRKYSYEQRRNSTLENDHERLFQANRKAWDFFQSQAPWYRRTATSWVMSAKKQETRHKRLATLITDSEHGRRIKPLSRPVPKRKTKTQ